MWPCNHVWAVEDIAVVGGRSRRIELRCTVCGFKTTKFEWIETKKPPPPEGDEGSN